MTESEIRQRASELFRDYVQKLNRQFRDSSIYVKTIGECTEIVLQLSKLGFDIKTTKSGRREMEELPNGEKIAVIKSSAQMSLVPKFSAASEPLEQAIVNTKIYGDSTTPEGIIIIPEEETNSNTEFNLSDLAFLKKHGFCSGNEKEVTPKVSWRFTKDQRHALLIALRHWNQLEKTAQEKGIFISPYETWRNIIEHSTEVWPDTNGEDRFTLCFLIECELKRLRVIREIIRKNGGTVLNVCENPNCSTVQHIQHIKTLEDWLDENLNRSK